MPINRVAVDQAQETSLDGSSSVRNPALWLLAAALCGALALALAVGAMPMPFRDILVGEAAFQRQVLVEIRAPRVALAGLVGAVLAASGAALQGLFRNPLADPGLIGVSGGAALGAVAMIVLGAGPSAGPWAAYALPLAAMLGAMLVTLFLWGFASRYGQFSIVIILLVGIAVNALTAVGVGAFQYLSDDGQLRTLTFWLMGSFGRASWPAVLPAALAMAAAATPLFLVAQALDLLQLGESEAFHLGVEVRSLKRRIILCAAAAVGAGVAVSGIIGFVGLVVPHLVRLLGGAGHCWVLPGSALLGAALTILADLLARTIAAPAEIPLSLVTSALGAPFFLWLIARARPI